MKIKVVISALIYPFTMAHFFWRAFERRDDVELFVAGPYTDNWIPWNNGIRIPPKYIKHPNFALPANSPRTTSQMIQNRLPWKPDLWLQIDAGWRLVNKPDAGIVAHIQTDPHVLKEQYKAVKPLMDEVFCMQCNYCEAEEIFLPYAYDPEIHFHEDRKKIYDACLIGLHYDHRDMLVRRLRDKGLSVYYSIGEVYDQYRQKYNESKIALSWSSLMDLPSRVWEAWGMGLPLVSNRVPDLKLFANDGEHYLGFSNIDEAEQQVMKLIEDEKLRNELAQNGHKNAELETWDKRVQSILESCGLA